LLVIGVVLVVLVEARFGENLLISTVVSATLM
jgi:hypothetical protein